MAYREIFVEWYNSGTENYRCLSFWHYHPTMFYEVDIVNFSKVLSRAGKIIKDTPPINTGVMEEPFWLIRKKRAVLIYNFIEQPSLDKKLFAIFKPQIHPKRIIAEIDLYRGDLTIIELAIPFVYSITALESWLANLDLNILWSNESFTQHPVSYGDYLATHVYAEPNPENANLIRLYFMDKAKAVLCKLAAPTERIIHPGIES